MAHRAVDSSENADVSAHAAAMSAEIEALRQQLAALKARLPGNALGRASPEVYKSTGARQSGKFICPASKCDILRAGIQL